MLGECKPSFGHDEKPGAVHTNTNRAFDYAYKLMGVKSPSELLELSTAHARKQFEAMTAQTKELTEFAEKVTTEIVEPIKAGVTKAFNNKIA